MSKLIDAAERLLMLAERRRGIVANISKKSARSRQSLADVTAQRDAVQQKTDALKEALKRTAQSILA